MKYIFVGVVSALIATILGLFIYVVSLKSDISDLNEVRISLQKELASCQSAIDLQNEITLSKNAELNSYSDKINEIQARFNAKSKELDKALGNVKTCEDGMNYLKTMLNTLKGL